MIGRTVAIERKVQRECTFRFEDPMANPTGIPPDIFAAGSSDPMFEQLRALSVSGKAHPSDNHRRVRK